MDYIGQLVALGIDSIFLGICLQKYFHCYNAVKAVKTVAIYDVSAELKKMVESSPTGTLNYIAIRGMVKPLGKLLHGMNNPATTGVIQRFTVKEHVVARTTAGFWSEQERTMQDIFNVVPFVLQNGSYQIEVVNPLSADILDMNVISNEFKPSAPTMFDLIWGFFTGVRQRGLQSTEEMLRDNEIITGIGEVLECPENPGTLCLRAPTDGTPFYLTSMSVGRLLRNLESQKKTYGWLCVICGTLTIVIGVTIARRYWKDRTEEQLAEELRRRLAESRKERRQRVRDVNLREDQLCVVCRENPREMIILPCGHVCLCEDCGEDINDFCPVCRARIEQKAAAYIA